MIDRDETDRLHTRRTFFIAGKKIPVQFFSEENNSHHLIVQVRLRYLMRLFPRRLRQLIHLTSMAFISRTTIMLEFGHAKKTFVSYCMFVHFCCQVDLVLDHYESQIVVVNQYRVLEWLLREGAQKFIGLESGKTMFLSDAMGGVLVWSSPPFYYNSSVSPVSPRTNTSYQYH